MQRFLLAIALGLVLQPSPGCAGIARKLAADAAAQSGTSYASDEDPELVRDAVPFGLKTMEGILQEEPEHQGLLLALSSGFTQYGYAFVQADADLADLEGKLDQARAGRERAARLYLRGRDYGLRGLDARHPKIASSLGGSLADARAALARLAKDDVPFLYWTAASWTLAIAANKGDMGLVAQLPIPVAMMERALELDEAWNDGALHEFFVVYDATRTAAEGGGPQRAWSHLERVNAITMKKKLGPCVSWAEGVLVPRGDRDAFTQLLEGVVRADPGEVPRFRLANIIAQRRARALLAHADDLFP